MTYIAGIKYLTPPLHRAFVAERLLALKLKLRQDIHQASDERSLRLATWNLMHFGDGGGYKRSRESMLYIAEIIDHFDLVAIQEVNENLTDFTRLMKYYLGDDWDYVLTDVSGGKAGNRERLAFAYRKAKVKFRKEAGEIVLEGGQEIIKPGSEANNEVVQFARTPFSVAFQAGWFKFRLCTVHIFYGKPSDNSPEMEQRRREIAKIATYLANRQKREQKILKDNHQDARAANYLLLGDFNIISPEHQTMQALENAGFFIPEGIKDAPSSLSGKNHYDQIAFRLADKRVITGVSGVFDMFDVVYREEDAKHYIDHVKPAIFDKKRRNRKQKIRYYKTYYRRQQMSDHKLLWCEIKTDFSDNFLADIRDSSETV